MSFFRKLFNRIKSYYICLVLNIPLEHYIFLKEKVLGKNSDEIFGELVNALHLRDEIRGEQLRGRQIVSVEKVSSKDRIIIQATLIKPLRAKKEIAQKKDLKLKEQKLLDFNHYNSSVRAEKWGDDDTNGWNKIQVSRKK
ncbi:MAG: hypothetical protein Q8Q23_00785 [bacterium]|nr:hypothetical protein [bacterium]